MLKQEVYNWVADTFGCSVGMAHIIDFHQKNSEVVKRMSKSDKVFDDELNINGIITDSIELNRYRKLQRELYRLDRKGYSSKIKEVTIYKRAWKEATNEDDNKQRNREQSSKI